MFKRKVLDFQENGRLSFIDNRVKNCFLTSRWKMVHSDQQRVFGRFNEWCWVEEVRVER